jgi:hypothetical protein
MYLVTNLLLKASLALFFLRFVIERWAKLTVCTITIVFSVWTFAVLLITIFIGKPEEHSRKVDGRSVYTQWETALVVNHLRNL